MPNYHEEEEGTPLLRRMVINGGQAHNNHQNDMEDLTETSYQTAAAATTSASDYGAVPMMITDEAPDDTTSTIRSVQSYQTAASKNSLQSFASRFGHSVREMSQRIGQAVVEHTGTIGYVGSTSIAVNTLTGPAMVNLPATFERSGIIPTCITLFVVCILSACCSLHMSNTISKVPGNNNFKKEIEFSEAFKQFWGNRWFVLSQILFTCCVTCLNISSIVDTSQVVDTFLGHWFPAGSSAFHVSNGKSWSIAWLRWDYSICTQEELQDGLCLPFGDVDQGILVTAGNLATVAIFLPLALMDLKENAWWQAVGFLILLVTSIQFVVQFTVSGLEPSRLSWWGYDYDSLFGVILFNFCLVVAVPAWLYEREPHVDVPTVVYGSSFFAVVLYIVVGILGCMAMPNVSENMLESMMSGTMGTAMQLGASIFAFAIIGLGIPLFSVLTRLNLTGSGLCSTSVGNLVAVYFPFAVALLLNGGRAVTSLLGWGGVIFTSLVAFILPLILTLHVVKEFDNEGSVCVYFGRLREKGPEITSLRVLLTVAVLSIFLAILGNIVDFDG